MNKSDDFDEVQDIGVMSVGGVVQGQVMVSLRMFLLIKGRSELCLLNWGVYGSQHEYQRLVSFQIIVQMKQRSKMIL